mmetsp:Transcript_29567/g.59687  ORF Transcript_29567/g.59687 Transcript_29567/m.59687 type:complete len:339 (-) Transcript_29567:449-1465(-)
MESSSHLVQLGLVVLFFVPEEVETCAEEEQSVPNISVHDSKQEGESRRSEQGRVGLSIPGNAIRVHELLISVRELVGGEVRRGGGPRLGHLIHVTGHVVVHVAVSAVDAHADVVKGLGNHPSLSAKHTRDIGLEHVEGVVDGLLAKDDPSPALGVLREHLAETETSVLVLEKDGARVDQFLSILGQHAVHGGGVIHVREGITVGEEGVADFFQLGLDGERFEEDDEHALLDERAGLGIGNRLFDGSKANVAVSAGGAEDHALETNLLLGGNHPGYGRETHVHVPGFVISPGQKRVGSGSGRLAPPELRHGHARGIGHEEPPGLLQHLLQFHFLVVLPR